MTTVEIPAVLRGDNEYLRLAMEEDFASERRRELVSDYSWAIPNDDALDAIAELSPIIEIGAGNGYWAMLLRERGADVGATDPHPAGSGNNFARRSWSQVERVSGLPAGLHVYPTLFLCWPSEDEVWPEKVLAEFSGPTVAYIGEPEGGCCASPGFFAMLERGFEQIRQVTIPRWYGMRDDLTIWRRKAT